ncbi:MAG: hypothetical protein A3J37_07300 [Alphaproteobacteria bacterium RIFCSPHIGHO2_12_FULL_45_9]|nr:MAG: hypothetical protein A3B66_04735 [Alphaproteobacteria bacterium RIFCSPHIGHO2_02_FULL_46_13]OFW96866.1 MAG: hypothetical protein A3J37_07300 [Alphaproteobacteria bacterium RIFCSPHIGHO2_12_FULL_45_9]
MPFENAQKWLDERFSIANPTKCSHTSYCEWELSASFDGIIGDKIRVQLPFSPVEPIRFYFAPDNYLKIPHVEKDGKVCIGFPVYPDGLTDIIEPIKIALSELNQFIDNVSNPAWRKKEFRAESLSYWNRYVLEHGASKKSSKQIDNTYIYLPTNEEVTSLETISFTRKLRDGKKTQTIIVSDNIHSPQLLAKNHGWDTGTLVNGSAIYIPVPDDASWTPFDWPSNFSQLTKTVLAFTKELVNLDDPAILEFDIQKGNPQPAKLVIFVQDNVTFTYVIWLKGNGKLASVSILPLSLTRVDPQWVLARDQNLDNLSNRLSKRVLVLGCGSLGSPIADMLARAGIGKIDLSDIELFNTENVSRHLLGVKAERRSKAESLADRIRSDIPNIDINGRLESAVQRIKMSKIGDYDLVLDCTANQEVRMLISTEREKHLGNIPVIHTWLEVHGVASHVVITFPDDPWPINDPLDKINIAANSSDELQIKVPACGAGFYPYGYSDALKAASLTAEKALAVIDGEITSSEIVSSVKSAAYFKKHGVEIHKPDLASSQPDTDSNTIIRDYSILHQDGPIDYDLLLAKRRLASQNG